MVPFVTSMWVAAALAQSPSAAPEAAWLKAVPAEAEVVIRVRAPKAVRDDLAGMVQAMSPNMGPMAGPALDNGLAMFSQRFGADAQNLPFLIVARLPKPDDNGPPPYAVLIQAKDYASVQKQLGPDTKPEPQGGGIDKVAGADGQTLYTYKGASYVAFGNSKEVLTSLAKPAKTLDTTLTAELRDRFFGGDAGVYVNLAAIQARYGDQIEGARKDLLDRLEKGAAGNAGSAQNGAAMKTMVNLLFEALKNGDALAAHLDFDAKGLAIGGLTAVKPGSDAAKLVAAARPGTGEALGKLPADAAFYLYSSVSPASFDRYQKLATSFMPGGGAASPDQDKALKLAREAGPKELTAAATFGKGGSQSIGLSTYDDPKKAVEATVAGIAAMKANKASLPDMIKDITVTRDAESYKGFTFAKTSIVYDKEKLKAMSPKDAPAGGPNPEALQALMGDGVTSWVGTDGKSVLQVNAPDWKQAKARIDAVLAGGSASLAQAANYQAIRAALPKQVGTLVLINAQALITQGLATFAAVMPDSPVAKAQLTLPPAPAFFGGSVTPVAKGFQFQFLLPSAVGPVVEQAVGPIVQGLQGNKVEQ